MNRGDFLVAKWEKESDEIVWAITRKEFSNSFNNSITLDTNETALFLKKEEIIGSVTSHTVKLGGLFDNRSLNKADTIILIDTSIKQAEWVFSGGFDEQKVRSSGCIRISIAYPELFIHSYLDENSLDNEFVLFIQELISGVENNLVNNVLEQQVHLFSVDRIKSETEVQLTIQNELENELKNYLSGFGMELISFNSRWSFGSRRNLRSASIPFNDSLDTNNSSEFTDSSKDNLLPESEQASPVKTRGLVSSGKQNAEDKTKPDCVNFTLTAPTALAPGNDYELGVWAYLKEQEQEMIEAAMKMHEMNDISEKSKKSVPVERETYIAVSIEIPEFEIDETQDTIYWDGELANATFMVDVPEDLAFGKYRGKLLFLVEGLQIAKLDFKLTVGNEVKSVSNIPVNQTMVHSAFVSYASDDRDAVLARIHMLEKIIPDIDLFIDLVSLHSGEDWYKRLTEEITKRDIFYLFWSEAASKSDWVEKEWRAALESRGIEIISPVPLVSPDKVPPPKELAALHFNDWILAYLKEN